MAPMAVLGQRKEIEMINKISGNQKSIEYNRKLIIFTVFGIEILIMVKIPIR